MEQLKKPLLLPDCGLRVHLTNVQSMTDKQNRGRLASATLHTRVHLESQQLSTDPSRASKHGCGCCNAQHNSELMTLTLRKRAVNIVVKVQEC